MLHSSFSEQNYLKTLTYLVMPTSYRLEAGDSTALSRLSPLEIQTLRAFSRYSTFSFFVLLFFASLADHLQSVRLDIVMLPLNIYFNSLSIICFRRILPDNYPAPCRGPPPSTPKPSSTSAGALPMALPLPFPSSMS